MSELIDSKVHHSSRRDLLASVSVAVLVACSSAAHAASDDNDRPVVWIEVGGDFDAVQQGKSIFAPVFFSHSAPDILAPMVDSQKLPQFGFASEGKITFAPEDSNWVFSARVRYGQTNGGNHLHHESAVSTKTQLFPSSNNFIGDGQTLYHGSHFILDFQAGKDVGLGMFGAGSTSLISAGVRFAQFDSNAHVSLHARPYIHNSRNAVFPSKYIFRDRNSIAYTAVVYANHSTRAIGPALSWDASVPVVRPSQQTTFNFDWGLDGSILFGRQTTRVHQQTSIYRLRLAAFSSPPTQGMRSVHPAHQTRARNVTVPNIGGFLGASLKFPNAKVSIGYRADLFFNAIDEGYDTRKSSMLGFYAPFATVSVGLGG